MRIQDIQPENRPRERFSKSGAHSLSDAELLSIILQTGTRTENVVDMCNRLLSRYGIGRLSELSLTELQAIRGIGPAKAMQIKALFEFNKRHYSARKNAFSKPIGCAKDVYKLMYEYVLNKKKELLYGIYLDSKNHVIEKPELISIGILDCSLIHPREVLKEAVRKSAKSFILVHNHPSGDCSPSSEDKEITERIQDAGVVLDIKLLDHVIIGKGYFSFRDANLL